LVISYLDTSAAMKLLVEEAESDALAAYLQSAAAGAVERSLVASWLLHTELHCAANRHPDEVDLNSVAVVLDTLSLIDVTRGDLLTAGTLPGQLRSHDAIHLAVALRIGADEVLTYDAEFAHAAAAAGLPVAQPA
jgi:predicted nucleic acid-binding protein